GVHKRRPPVETAFNETEVRVSPDGIWLAYVSDESGQNDVFVQSMNDPSARVQISRDTGSSPRWARSGNELLYLSKDRLISVKLAPGGELNPGKTVALLEDKRTLRGYDLACECRLLVSRLAV